MIFITLQTGNYILECIMCILAQVYLPSPQAYWIIQVIAPPEYPLTVFASSVI